LVRLFALDKAELSNRSLQHNVNGTKHIIINDNPDYSHLACTCNKLITKIYKDTKNYIKNLGHLWKLSFNSEMKEFAACKIQWEGNAKGEKSEGKKKT
jgi:hypothetical protein